MLRIRVFKRIQSGKGGTMSEENKGYITVEKTSDNSDYIFKVVKKIEATELEKEALSILTITVDII